jgi:hypothetical protein
LNVAPASGAARFGTIADWNAVEFARRLYGLAVSASTPPGRLDLHPIEFNKQSRCHGSLSKRREAANIHSLTAEARGPDQRRCLPGRNPLFFFHRFLVLAVNDATMVSRQVNSAVFLPVATTVVPRFGCKNLLTGLQIYTLICPDFQLYLSLQQLILRRNAQLFCDPN